MSQEEAAILELISLSTDRYFTLIQWWVSISVGVVAVSHFASDKLNRFLLIALLGIYVAYTTYMVSILALTGQYLGILVDALDNLESGGVSLSVAGQSMLNAIENPTLFHILGGSAFPVAVIGGFLVAVSYVIYAYRKTRRPKSIF